MKERVRCERLKMICFENQPHCSILNLTFLYIWSTFPLKSFTNFYFGMRLLSLLNLSQYKDNNIVNIFIFYSNSISLIAREAEIFHVFINHLCFLFSEFTGWGLCLYFNIHLLYVKLASPQFIYIHNMVKNILVVGRKNWNSL